MLKEYEKDGWHSVVFVEHDKTNPSRGLPVSIDYESILCGLFAMPYERAQNIALALWKKGYWYTKDFMRASVYKDCFSVLKDKHLTSELIRAIRNSENGN